MNTEQLVELRRQFHDLRADLPPMEYHLTEALVQGVLSELSRGRTDRARDVIQRWPLPEGNATLVAARAAALALLDE